MESSPNDQNQLSAPEESLDSQVSPVTPQEPITPLTPVETSTPLLEEPSPPATTVEMPSVSATPPAVKIPFASTEPPSTPSEPIPATVESVHDTPPAAPILETTPGTTSAFDNITLAPASAMETPSIPSQPKATSPMMLRLIIGVVSLIILVGVIFGAYAWGHNNGYTSGKMAQMTAATIVAPKVPANATIISQCSAGEGTQYVLPSDIPQGPIYNVWNNKVTGVEYMLAQSKIAAAMTQDLTLLGQQYNHVDVMYEAAGHAGFTEPHYHVTFSLISFADEQKITCSSSPSSMMQ